MIIFGVCLIFNCQNIKQEPTYKNKTINEWIKDLKQDNEAIRMWAGKHLQRIGQEAVPALIQELKNKNQNVRINAAYALCTMGSQAKTAVPILIEALNDKNYEVRVAAVISLGRFGKEAKSAIPELEKLHKTSNGDKIQYWEYIASEGWKFFAWGFNDVVDGRSLREKAYSSKDVVVGRGKTREEALSDLDSKIKKIQYLSFEAYLALENINRTDESPYKGKTIARWVEDRVSEDTLVTAKADSVLQELNEAAIPCLLKVLTDKQTSLSARNHVTQVIAEIGPRAYMAVPALIDLLKYENDDTLRAIAAQALGMIGPGAKDAVPELIKALKCAYSGLRLNSAFALGEVWFFSSDIHGVVPALIEALKDVDEGVRKNAAYSLGDIGRHASIAASALAEAMKDESSNVRKNSAYALGTINSDKKVAVPTLIKGLADDDYYVRKNCAEALAKITGKNFGEDQERWYSWWGKNN
jgi:HEAT repeat protein